MSAPLDLAKLEMHNIVRAAGGLRTRRGLVSLSSDYGPLIGAFTIESASTTEPWHYLFSQGTDGRVTLTVTTEALTIVFSHDLGFLPENPVITYAVANGQVMINSPSFSAPLYGLPGGGLITAVKTPSINSINTTALDIPAGHIAAFGDRFAIAQGPAVFFNDPPTANSADPRTFVAQNILPLPGSVYDLFQGPDGALYMFTSAGVFTLPADALGQGQSVQGSLARIPGIDVSRPGNAIASAGVIAVLQRDHVLLLPSRTKIDLTRKGNRRRLSPVVDVEDLRLASVLYATPSGFVVAFRGKRSFFAEVRVADGSVTYVSGSSTALNVVGVLRSRDGEHAYVLPLDIIMPFQRAKTDSATGDTIRGALVGRIPTKQGDRPMVRRVTVDTDNASYSVDVDVDGKTDTKTTPTRTGDVIVGTSVWGAATKLAGRTMRAVRLDVAAQTVDPHLEIAVTGGDFRIGDAADVTVTGQGRNRGDVS